MHWTQRGREGEIFFLSNGSGSAISLSFKKTSKEVGVGSIFFNLLSVFLRPQATPFNLLFWLG